MTGENMKTYKKVEKKVEDKVYCDVCGAGCTEEPLDSEYATLEAKWGYGSSRDGEQFDIQLCEKCFSDTIGWMTQKRKQYLRPFDYPFEKDPLKGQI